MRGFGSAAAVAAAVREDAAAAIERIERRTEEEIERLRSEEQAAEVSPPDRDERLAEARRRAREIVAGEDAEDSRSALQDRESWMQRAVAAGMRGLRERIAPGVRRRDLTRLACEALMQVRADRCEIELADDDLALADAAWLGSLASETGKKEVRLAERGETLSGGCIARSVDGKIAFDNAFEARARRLESTWRAELGKIYARSQRVSSGDDAAR